MNVKQTLRTVVVPVIAGAIAAGVAIIATRPTLKPEPDYDVPTEDEPPFIMTENLKVSTEPLPTAHKSRKPKTI